MNLKTSQIKALERGSVSQDSTDIELLGTEALCCDPKLSGAIQSGLISSKDNSFVSIFGLDVKFFYALTLECPMHGFTEVGIGYIEQHDGKFYLKRAKPKYMYENGIGVRTQRPRPIVCSDTSYILVSSYIPNKYHDVLTDSNSIIVSSHPHVPSCVTISENSVLGRQGQSVEPIQISKISDFALEHIKAHTKTLVLKSNNVKVKKLSADSINLTPSSSITPKKGTIYYDESQDVIKYFNGETWRILVWQED